MVDMSQYRNALLRTGPNEQVVVMPEDLRELLDVYEASLNASTPAVAADPVPADPQA